MKNLFKYGFIVMAVFAISACDDFLNTEPISDIASNGFYSNTEEVEAGLIAVYDGLQSMDYDEDIEPREFALTEMRSDNTKTKSSEGEWAQFETMNVDETNSSVSEYWLVMYNVIYRANIVLENLGSVSDGDTKEQFKSEARFVCALAHFNLVRAFGDIPLVKSVVTPENTSANIRVATSTVYDFIITELIEIAPILPKRSEIAEGRATQGAAYALLAKAQLTVGDYSGAQSSIESVMATNDYALVDDYYNVFYNELNEEIIFAIQYLADDSEDSQDFSYEFTALGVASGLNFPTDDLLAAVDTADLRYNTLFYWNSSAGGMGMYECGKFRPITAANSQYGGNDWIVLRYADVLLMYVEAIMAGSESTNNAAAVEAFNSVRTRAGMPTVSSVTKQMLLDERRVELAFENQRLYDLIRFGEAESVMSAFSQTVEGGFSFDATKLLLPIPQRERNLNSGLSQNPGYN